MIDNKLTRLNYGIIHLFLNKQLRIQKKNYRKNIKNLSLKDVGAYERSFYRIDIAEAAAMKKILQNGE